jgi:hypothetical protein
MPQFTRHRRLPIRHRYTTLSLSRSVAGTITIAGTTIMDTGRVGMISITDCVSLFVTQDPTEASS